jgi:polyisoprenoid-binding protein YceI
MAKIKWAIDTIHSELGFRIKHLMITNVSGSFGEYEAEVQTEDEDFSTAQVQAKIKAGSVSTNNNQRDEHLRNGDFFDVDAYPEILFQSERIEASQDDQFVLHGNLTMRGITKPVKLHVEYNGVAKDPWGGRRAGFLVTGKIKRSDFGLSFNTVLETGGVALSDEVKINGEIQLVKQEAAVLEETA